jgi:hypothetical protein
MSPMAFTHARIHTRTQTRTHSLSIGSHSRCRDHSPPVTGASLGRASSPTPHNRARWPPLNLTTSLSHHTPRLHTLPHAPSHSDRVLDRFTRHPTHHLILTECWVDSHPTHHLILTECWVDSHPTHHLILTECWIDSHPTHHLILTECWVDSRA